MAIIQSILVGKGKGKIGNVVLSGLKGQTIAKQLNSSPSNPRTVAQTANRVKMANAVLAWQFLANFMSYAKGLRKPLESVFNAFVRTVVPRMNVVLESSRSTAAAYALAFSEFIGNWFTVQIDTGVGDSTLVEFNSSGLSWAPSYRVVLINFNPVAGTQKVIEREVTQAEFDNGKVTFTLTETGVVNIVAAYVYDNATSKITNIAYFTV